MYDGGYEATKAVLRSISSSGTVRRVVYTSSVAGVIGMRPAGHIWTEADWADNGDADGPADELPFGYGRSKADTERLMYSWAARHSRAPGATPFDVVS